MTTVHCDTPECKSSAELTYKTDVLDIPRALTVRGWMTDDGKHYCPACTGKPVKPNTKTPGH